MAWELYDWLPLLRVFHGDSNLVETPVDACSSTTILFRIDFGVFPFAGSIRLEENNNNKIEITQHEENNKMKIAE